MSNDVAPRAIKTGKRPLPRVPQEREGGYARSLIEASLDPLVTIGPDGKITDVNEATVEATGVPREKLVGSDFAGYFTEPEKARAGYREVFAKGAVRDYPLAIRHAAGKITEVLYNASLYRDEKGKVAGIFAAARDITELKRAKEKAELQATLVDLAHDAILVFDLKDRITLWNRGAEAAYGWSMAEAIGHMSHELLNTRFPASLEELMAAVRDSGRWQGELVHRTRDGREIVVESLWSLQRDEKGAPKAVLEINRDITERRRSEQVLRYSERRYRALVETSAQIVWNTDAAGQVGGGLPSWQAFTGQSADEVRGAGWFDAVHPDDRPRVTENWLRAIGAGLSYESRYRLRRQDGDYRLVESRAVPVRDADGAVQEWIGTCTDITERDRAERALRQGEERYRSLVAATAQIVWTTDAQGAVSADLPTWRAFTGQSRDEVLGRGWVGALHPEDRERALQVWSRAVETRSLYETRYRLRRYDGEYRLMLARGVPVLEPEGPVREWVGACTDITEAEEAEQKAQKAGAYARRLIEASLDPLVTIDAEGKITDVNDATVRATGLPREKLVGSEFAGYFTEPDRARAGYREVFAKGFVTDYPLVLRHASGKAIDVLYNASLYRDEKGEVAGAFAAARDVTARKQAEEKLRSYQAHLEELVKTRTAEVAERNQELQAAVKELEAFSYSVSHDLRAPLRAIDGFSRILVEEYGGKLDEEGRRIVGVVRDGTQKMGRLIDDILSFSRIGRQDMAVADMDMGELVQDALKELEPALQGREVAVKVGALPQARGDPAMIRRVWLNLLDNAIKFTRPVEKATIEIGAREEPGQRIYFVKDNGVGFDMQYAGKLFAVFQRLHGEEEFPGTGIGLAIVKRIVTRHGGRVWAEGKVNAGATFSFTLPAAEKGNGTETR